MFHALSGCNCTRPSVLDPIQTRAAHQVECLVVFKVLAHTERHTLVSVAMSASITGPMVCVVIVGASGALSLDRNDA